MNALSESIVELLDRMRRRPPSRWALRGLLVLCGAAAEIWLLLVAGASPWTVVASIAIVAGAVFARGVVPLLTAAVIVVQAALAALPVLELVPLALALLGWHLCASLLATGRPWAAVDGAVVRALRMPVLGAVAATLVVAAAAVIAGGLAWGEAGVVTLLVALALVLGAIVVLWPGTGSRDR